MQKFVKKSFFLALSAFFFSQNSLADGLSECDKSWNDFKPVMDDPDIWGTVASEVDLRVTDDSVTFSCPLPCITACQIIPSNVTGNVLILAFMTPTGLD